MSTTTPVQIRVNTITRQQANELFADMGMDMSTAVNIFLRQCIIYGGIPFRIKSEEYSDEFRGAIEEAKYIRYNPNSDRGYTFEEYQAAMRELVGEDA